MNYLQDRKTKKRKWQNVAMGVVFLIIIFYFRSGIFGGLSYASSIVFRPIISAGNNVGDRFSNSLYFFTSKSSLGKENEDLKSELAEKDAAMANHNALVADNESLKEILGRKKEDSNFILGAILSKPNQSPYDTLIIDIGSNKGIKAGSIVFAKGNIPIGKINDVFPYSSKVILFSNPGEKTEVVISGRDVFTTITGRGGGNFEMIVPRDFDLPKGSEVVLPGISSYVIGIVETIISDPRDANTRALLTSPINIFELKFVEVGQ